MPNPPRKSCLSHHRIWFFPRASGRQKNRLRSRRKPTAGGFQEEALIGSQMEQVGWSESGLFRPAWNLSLKCCSIETGISDSISPKITSKNFQCPPCHSNISESSGRFHCKNASMQRNGSAPNRGRRQGILHGFPPEVEDLQSPGWSPERFWIYFGVETWVPFHKKHQKKNAKNDLDNWRRLQFMTAHACHAHRFWRFCANENIWQIYADQTQITRKHNVKQWITGWWFEALWKILVNLDD